MILLSVIELIERFADKGLYMTLLKAYQKQKTEKVNNLQNLIMLTFNIYVL